MSRKRIFKLLAMIVFGLAIAIGCNNNSPESTTSKLASSSTEEYRLVKDAIATIKVPFNPQRLITLHGTALESVLALGEKSVGTTLNGKLETQPDFLRQQLTDVEIIGSFDEFFSIAYFFAESKTTETLCTFASLREI